MCPESPIDAALKAGHRLSAAELAHIIEAGDVIEALKAGGPKVICSELSSGCRVILKLWYPQRLLSSTRLFPYSHRFRKNAAKLRARKVNAPRVMGWGSVGNDGTHFVCYEELPGRSLRQWLPEADLTALGQFVARLHQAGIDFRSLHMGNILWDGDDAYSLVDVTDCGFRSRPLSLSNRVRRMVYLCTHRREREYFKVDGRWIDLFKAYCETARIPPEDFIEAARHRRNRRRLPPGVRQAADSLLSAP